MAIQFFGQPGLAPVWPKRPLNILFLTSVRDVVGDDQNGQIVETSNGSRYMMGVPEATLIHSQPGEILHGLVKVVGLIADDTGKDAAKWNISPMPGERWIARHWALDTGAMNIPSNFRSLPLSDEAGRIQQKTEFESNIRTTMEFWEADVLVSDHYMARIDFLFPPALQFGRILNIHPAPTLEGHEFCFRGERPTLAALAMAEITNREVYTGATLHIVDPQIDHGPVVAFAADTRVYPGESSVSLRYRNYQTSKIPVFVAGLRHYVLNIFPHLDKLDLYALSRHGGSLRKE